MGYDNLADEKFGEPTDSTGVVSGKTEGKILPFNRARANYFSALDSQSSTEESRSRIVHSDTSSCKSNSLHKTDSHFSTYFNEVPEFSDAIDDAHELFSDSRVNDDRVEAELSYSECCNILRKWYGDSKRLPINHRALLSQILRSISCRNSVYEMTDEEILVNDEAFIVLKNNNLSQERVAQVFQRYCSINSSVESMLIPYGEENNAESENGLDVEREIGEIKRLLLKNIGNIHNEQ